MIYDEFSNRRFYGMYRGIVVDNTDPLNEYRLKLKIPQVLHDQVTDWAWSIHQPGVTRTIPVVGTGVWVSFEGGDPSYPIWTGTFKIGSTLSDVVVKKLTILDNIRVSYSANPYSLSTTDHPFQIGANAAQNLRLDNNGIQSVSTSGTSGTLNINTFGGTINLGNTTSTIAVLGNLEVGGGYGSTGVTISSVGVINADGAITGDGTVTGGNLTTGGSITRTALNGGGTTGASINNTGAIIRTTSSERYKQDIQSANFIYEDILLLSPKTFRVKEEVQSDSQARVYAGLIAEEVDQIESLKVFVNYLKQEDNSIVPDGIAYGEMVSVLVSAIKHQDGLIKSLSDRLDALENK
jgi:hypothetical protein